MAQDDDTSLPDEGNIVVVTSAFVRSGPGDNFASVGAVFEGDLVTPLNISSDGSWVLIIYSRRTAWIQRSLVRWENNELISRLPVLPANITPTPRFAITSTPFVPTLTPEGNFVDVQGASSVYVRGGPGRGYLRLGQLLPGDTVEPVSRNEDTTWILIRFTNEPLTDAFGWVATDLIFWEDIEALAELPIIELDNLTPTAVVNTPTTTPRFPDAESIASAGDTQATARPTNTRTAQNTDAPTAIVINSPTATATTEPSPTETNTLTATVTASSTPTATSTNTATATNTATSTATSSATATVETTEEIEVVEAVGIASNTPVPVTNTPTATHTATNTATVTPTATPTATATVTPTDIFAVQGTTIALEATQLADTPSSDIPDLEAIANEPAEIVRLLQAIPIEAFVGGGLLIAVLIYIWFYFQGLVAAGRYSDGFVIDTCPVCRRGELSVEKRPLRIMGIPGVRHTVRCDECRSILRETGTRRWRYAVDRLEDLRMYNQFNGREVTDNDLIRLDKSPLTSSSGRTSPTFVGVDDNSDDS